MSRQHAGALGHRLARWLALLALAGLALTCLGVYSATALSFVDRQVDTLRKKELQVRHLIDEAATLEHAVLLHKLDDAMIGRQDLTLVLVDAQGQRSTQEHQPPRITRPMSRGSRSTPPPALYRPHWPCTHATTSGCCHAWHTP